MSAEHIHQSWPSREIKLDLMPCPFCGGSVNIKRTDHRADGDLRSHFGISCCVQMGQFGPWGYKRFDDLSCDPEAMIVLAKRWNTRK